MLPSVSVDAVARTLVTLTGTATPTPTPTPMPGHEIHHHHHYHHHHYHHVDPHGDKPRPAVLGLLFGALLGFIAFATTFQMVRCAYMVRQWRRQRRLVAAGLSDEALEIGDDRRRRSNMRQRQNDWSTFGGVSYWPW